MKNNIDTEAQTEALIEELDNTYNNRLYTALAHEKPIPLHKRKIGPGPTKYYALQLIRGNHNGAGKLLPHKPMKPSRSKYIPHIGKKHLAKLEKRKLQTQPV
jgi:hypothetical protein